VHRRLNGAVAGGGIVTRKWISWTANDQLTPNTDSPCDQLVSHCTASFPGHRFILGYTQTSAR